VSTEKQGSVHAIDILQECADETAKYRHEWVEQPDLARVGEVGVWGEKREWVGLTHIEIGNLWAESQEVYSFAKAIDAKLKEKNT
jgi:hypothetical protein